jgi:hypothetical protein
MVWLAAGGEEGGKLVHLQERPSRFRDLDVHALGAGGVSGDVLVLDRLVEDRGEDVDEAADRGERERSDSPVAVVADVGAVLDRFAQFARLSELVGLEREAQLGVDPIEWVGAEERQ